MKEETDERANASRREFLKRTGAVTAVVTAGLVAPFAENALSRAETTAETPDGMPAMPVNAVTATSMPTRNLGKTGYKVGILSLGGQAAIEQPNNQEVAVAIVERAIDLGINYIDTAAMYGGKGRWSQKYIGEVMKRRRKECTWHRRPTTGQEMDR